MGEVLGLKLERYQVGRTCVCLCRAVCWVALSYNAEHIASIECQADVMRCMYCCCVKIQRWVRA